MNPWLTTLAQDANDWREILFWVAMAIFWVIGAAVKWWQEKQEKQATGKPTGRTDPEQTVEPQKENTLRRRLEELAEQRRRQLQEMARDQESGEHTQAPDRPVITRQPPHPTQAEESRADPLRRATEQARHREAEREIAQKRQRRVERQGQRELDRQRELARQAAKTPEAQIARTTVQAERIGHVGQVHHHTPDAAAAPPLVVVVPRRLTRSQLTAARLREAIILKEVIDKPIALRDPDAFPLDW